jgi:serine/threonine protein kinase
VDEHWRVKISDFGTVVSKEKMGNTITGTTAWMSPVRKKSPLFLFSKFADGIFLYLFLFVFLFLKERLIGESSDETTDVFSFAVILWELLTRESPWKGLSNLQVRSPSPN